MQVPCGKCEECRSMNRNEWFIRCYFEWQRCRNSSFFYTLTYNNEHLPLYQGHQRFSKRDIQKFLKKLRFRLYKLDIKCKYMVCCEFGELRKRVHYHVSFYLNKEINPYWFLRFVEDSWTDENGNSMGFVKTGDNVGLISSSSGIQYVTKYVTKDMSHLNDVLPVFAPLVYERYKLLFNYVCERWNKKVNCSFRVNSDYSFSRVPHPCCTDKDINFVQKFLTKMRRIINDIVPFHLQSSRLGSNIAEQDISVLEQIPILRNNGQVQMSIIPRYIKRMLWYDRIEGENTGKRDTFVLNERGKAHLLEKLQFDIERDKLRFQNILLNSSSTGGEIIPNLKTLGYDFQHPRDVVHWCQHFDLDLEVLSIYKNVLRGRVCEYDITSMDSQTIKDSWFDIAHQSIYASSNMDFGTIYKNQSLVTALNSLLWNLHPYFQVYEQSLQILEQLDLMQRDYACKARLEKENKKRQLSQYLQMFN